MSQKSNHIKDLIDQMFIIAGYPEVGYDDIIGRKDNWYQQWTMTEDQRKEWMDWGVAYFRKKKRWNKKTAEREMAYIDLYCGLKSAE
jgi:hypothetical protein